MNAVVWHGDSLSRQCKGVFLIENAVDDYLGFSDINIMPYNSTVKRYFQISKWNGQIYPEHIETGLKVWNEILNKRFI